MITAPETFGRRYYEQINFRVKQKVKYGDHMVNQPASCRSHYPVIFTVPWTEGEMSTRRITDALVWKIRIF